MLGVLRLHVELLEERQTGILAGSVVHDIDVMLAQIANEKQDMDTPRRLDPLIPIKLLIESYFSIEEIDDLAFNMGINPERIAGETIGERARGLVIIADNKGRLPGLLNECRKERPHVDWPE